MSVCMYVLVAGGLRFILFTMYLSSGCEPIQSTKTQTKMKHSSTEHQHNIQSVCRKERSIKAYTLILNCNVSFSSFYCVIWYDNGLMHIHKFISILHIRTTKRTHIAHKIHLRFRPSISCNRCEQHTHIQTYHSTSGTLNMYIWHFTNERTRCKRRLHLKCNIRIFMPSNNH